MGVLARVRNQVATERKALDEQTPEKTIRRLSPELCPEYAFVMHV